MSQINLPIQANSLPAGFCPASNQDLLNAFAAASFAVLNTGGGSSSPVASGFVISATKPSDTTVAWQQLDTLGRPTRLYVFAQGAWLSLHPTVPGLTQWWFGALPDFTVFDGGDANPLSSISGPMWQQALNTDNTVITAKFPVAAGTLPSGTIIAAGNTGGEEKHQLLINELPQLVMKLSGVGLNFNLPTPAAGNYIAGSDTRFPTIPHNVDILTQPLGGNSSNIADSHNTMPPYVVGYLLQRSQRLYYSA